MTGMRVGGDPGYHPFPSLICILLHLGAVRVTQNNVRKFAQSAISAFCQISINPSELKPCLEAGKERSSVPGMGLSPTTPMLPVPEARTRLMAAKGPSPV